MLVWSLTPASAAAYRTVADEEGIEGRLILAGTTAVRLDDTGLDPAFASAVSAELAASLEVWGVVDCAHSPLTFGGRAGESTVDGVTVQFLEDWSASGEASNVAGTSELVLVTDAERGPAIAGATIFLNGEVDWAIHPTSDGGAHDLRAVLVHELGHVLGLAHICEPPGLECGPDDLQMTMSPTYFGAAQASLGADDVAALCFLYPRTEVPLGTACDTSRDCFEGETCSSGGCVEETRFGESCSRADDCPGDRCVDTESGGICTFRCSGDEGCPSGAACLPVEGSPALSVCAPLEGNAGCAAAPGTSRVTLPLVVSFAIVLAPFLRRRRT